MKSNLRIIGLWGLMVILSPFICLALLIGIIDAIREGGLLR